VSSGDLAFTWWGHASVTVETWPTETTSGAPLAFGSVSRLSGSESRTDGRVHDGTVDIAITTGGAIQRRTMAWPAGALLPEGLRLAGVRAGLKPGSSYSALAFQPSSLEAADITSVIAAARIRVRIIRAVYVVNNMG